MIGAFCPTRCVPFRPTDYLRLRWNTPWQGLVDPDMRLTALILATSLFACGHAKSVSPGDRSQSELRPPSWLDDSSGRFVHPDLDDPFAKKRSATVPVQRPSRIAAETDGNEIEAGP